MIRQLENMNSGNSETDVTHVKIEDINMPLGALIGFMLIVTFVSIPVGIILGAIYLLIMVII